MLPRRCELKYLVPERIACAVRDAAAPHLRPDEHASQPHVGYPVCSLYLDSPDWALFRHTAEGRAQRFKLRIRLYDSQPDSPVFCEVKHRHGQIIIKQRVLVSRSDVQAALLGRSTVDVHFDNFGGTNHADRANAWREFWRLQRQLRATGRVYVVYNREAYVGRDDSHTRVTFDRQLLGKPYSLGELLRVPTSGSSPPLRDVILELKFDGRFPAWMHQLVQRFQLERASMPKYVECVRACGLLR